MEPSAVHRENTAICSQHARRYDVHACINCKNHLCNNGLEFLGGGGGWVDDGGGSLGAGYIFN